MIVSLFHVRVPEQATAGFEQSWTKRAGMVDKMPGFKGLEILRAGDEPGKYIVLTRWETRADYDGWASSPAFTAGHAHSSQAAQEGQPGAQPAGLEFYEVLTGGSVATSQG
ncbi:MAG TPA: antibiotic biosynthesis monooxygenase [Ktedonobacterales bacterium]|nr:antibiotic biosynthesis monooxygenase [Ktedonobacterales bacterium]